MLHCEYLLRLPAAAKLMFMNGGQCSGWSRRCEKKEKKSNNQRHLPTRYYLINNQYEELFSDPEDFYLLPNNIIIQALKLDIQANYNLKLGKRL